MKKRFLFIGLMVFICGCAPKDIVVDPIIIGGESTNTTNFVSTGGQRTSVACSSAYKYGDKGTPKTLSESGYYTTHDDVALYLTTFRKLPSNYVKKDSGEKPAGNMTRYGGDYFSNKSYTSPTGYCLPANFYYLTECDVDASGTAGNKRGTKRIVYTTTYRVFYTYDHYEHWQEYLGYNNWGPTFASGYFVNICK